MAGGMLASSAGSLASCLWGLARHCIALTALRALHALHAPPRWRAEGGERMGSLTLFPGSFPVQSRVRESTLSSLTGGFGSANRGGLQGGDNWQRMPGYLLLLPLLFLSVVPAALKIIEDEVRSPKAVSRPRLVGGQEGPLGQAQGAGGRWQLLSSRPGYLVLGASSCVESVPVPGAVLDW